VSFESTPTALALAAMVQKREVSVLEVVDHYLAVIDRVNPLLNAVTFRRDDVLRREAGELDAKFSGIANDDFPPFWGVPIAIKALTSVQGWPMDQCSRAASGNIETESHDVISALQRAGFLLLCQTASPELGSVPVTESEQYGATRNPWGLEYSPGGSSGGAAACVAAGMAPIAEGSDGGGSLRIPASCCGLVGLKPSRGRVFVGPRFTESMITSKGVLSRSVLDTAALLDVLKSLDPLQWNRAPVEEESYLESAHTDPGKLRIGFCLESPLDSSVDSECIEAVKFMAGKCSQIGHDVFEANLDWRPAEEFVENFMTVWAAHIGDFEADDISMLEPHNRFLHEQSQNISCLDYRRAVMALQRISRRVAAAWINELDVLLTPTMATKPPKIGEILKDSQVNSFAPFLRCFDMVPFTPWFNVTGQPAISLPGFTSSEGLPIGVQMVGKPWDEKTLLQLARQLEVVVGWQCRPPIGAGQ